MSWTAVPAGGGQHFAAVFIKITHYQSACYHRSLHAAPCSVIRIPYPAPNTTPQHTHTQDTSDWNITAHTVLIQTSPITNTPFPNSKSEQSFHSANLLTSEKLKRNMMVISKTHHLLGDEHFQETPSDDLMDF